MKLLFIHFVDLIIKYWKLLIVLNGIVVRLANQFNLNQTLDPL